ncbi:MAG: VWA domain-containing protein [Planctomycetaceae bacterium]
MMKALTLTLAAAMICSSIPMSAQAASDQVKLDVTPVRGVLKAGDKQTTWIRVGLEGFQLESEKQRPPVNLAIVLDKSGSMQGDKIQQAINGAIDALSLLGPNDIVSVITYDSTVNVLVPATKLTDKESVAAAIRGITAGGNTALFAGVSKGAAEVRKFLEKERVNRVILLSDGLANVGPSAPGELGALGATLLEENISVSTLGLGLGYNEDLMVALAAKSGGNHQFIEKATELADIFRREFDDVLSVVAQEIDVKITIPEGIRPVRVLGNEADINGQQIVIRMSQIYSRQNKHVAVEVEVPASEAGGKLDLATVSVSYANMKTHESDHLSGSTAVKFSASAEDVEKSLNKDVLADVVALVSSEQSKLATIHLDNGDFAACRQVLKDNVDFLNTNALLCPTDDRLSILATINSSQLRQLEGVNDKAAPAANEYRKAQRALSFSVDQQQEIAPAPAPAPAP